jgi:hypothetical protein
LLPPARFQLLRGTLTYFLVPDQTGTLLSLSIQTTCKHVQFYLDKYGTCMLTSLVIVSRQPAYSTQVSHLSSSSQVTKFPVVHPLSIHQVTKCFFRNSFVLKTIHFDGGGVCTLLAVLLRPRSLRPYMPPPIRFLFKLLRTLLHFFALPKISTLLFSSNSALCAKKHNRRGWGRGNLLTSLQPTRRVPGRHIISAPASVSVNGACPDRVGTLSAASALIPIPSFDIQLSTFNFQLSTFPPVTSHESRVTSHQPLYHSSP